jgi:Reverse transcriptase (RNA-dependent DNA polymerase)
LESLAEARAEEEDLTKENILKQLIQHEIQRNMFRRIRSILGQFSKKVNAIEVQNSDGEWTLMTGKEDIENGCIAENIRRFTQAANTPPLQPLQISLLGWRAEGVVANNIINGNTDLDPRLHPAIARMAPFFRTPDNIIINGPIIEDISDDEYIYRWKRCKEHTSSGPSGLHFGHFKASCQSKSLCQLDKWFIETAIKTGYSLERWHHGVDVMIPKKQESLRVDKLRTIVLMEADYNYMNKIIGRRIMKNAEDANTIAPEQFGSRKQKSSIANALNKLLTTDILRQEKRNFSLITLDAKACYDRIAQPIASIALKRQGATNNMVDVMFNTISKMQRCIRTAYGDSSLTYQETSTRHHGILQGNGAGPTIWIIISSPMLDRLRQQGLGVKIKLTDNTEIIIPAFAFVDDVDLIQEITKENNKLPQTIVTEWEDSLVSTGEMLVAEKCRFFVVRHCWEKNKWRLMESIDENTTITIKDDQDIEHQIPQKRCGTGELALGLMFAPSGSMTDQVNHLRKKAEVWAELVRTGHIKRHEAWIALNTTIMKTIEYALPATTMSRKDLDYVMKPVTNIGLSKAGICRNMARKVVFTPNTFQGLGLNHPYDVQGIRKIEALFDISQPFTLQLIEGSWHRTMIECGQGTDFLESDYERSRGIVTAGWISSLWQFLSERNITLKRNCRKFQREYRNINDSYIMTDVLTTKNEWSKDDLEIFNNCRLYLRVELLSDISTADGVSIRCHLWNGKKDKGHENFSKSYVDQDCPSPAAWNIWKRILKHTYVCNDNGKFQVARGVIRSSTDWKWYWDRSIDRIYCRTGKSLWNEFSKVNHTRSTRQPSFGNVRKVDKVAEMLIPITVYSIGDVFKIDGKGIQGKLPANEESTWYQRCKVTVVGEESALIECLQQEQPILMSDGSYKPCKSSAAWILTTTQAYEAGNYVYGTGHIADYICDSHRAECYGILGGLLTWRQLKNQWRIKNNFKDLLICCDNKSAINYAGNHSAYKYITSKIADYDILQPIREILKGERFTYKHVKGHQDREGGTLDLLATLNVHVDKLAGDIGDEEWHNYIIDGSIREVRIGSYRVQKNLQSTFLEFINRDSIKEYWDTKGRVNSAYFENVDWDSMRKVMKTSTSQIRNWIVKRAAQDCAANAVLFKRRQKDSDHCKFCGAEETVLHVYLCAHEDVTSVWTQQLKEFQKDLIRLQTYPCITNALIIGLQQWRKNEHGNTLGLITDQDKIGWNGILEGCIRNHWKHYQAQYYNKIQSKKSSERWAQHIIRKLWKIAWNLWENRNKKEHEKDKATADERVKHEVESELLLGTQNIYHLRELYSDLEISKARGSNLSYAKAWLRQVQSIRAREKRREERSGSTRQMRNTMYKFLHRNVDNIAS